MLTIDKGSVSSVDALEQVLLEGEAAVARIRAHHIQALARLDVAQVHTADGTRTTGGVGVGPSRRVYGYRKGTGGRLEDAP